jgi:hypothetical protein
MSYMLQGQFDQSLTLPISLPETELRRQRSMQLGLYPLALGQTLELRSLSIHLVKILTPGALPVLDNTVLGLCSVSILLNSMATSGLANVRVNGLGTGSWPVDEPVIITTPALYRVVVFNNANNVDLSVSVTGSFRFFQ